MRTKVCCKDVLGTFKILLCICKSKLAVLQLQTIWYKNYYSTTGKGLEEAFLLIQSFLTLLPISSFSCPSFFLFLLFRPYFRRVRQRTHASQRLNYAIKH